MGMEPWDDLNHGIFLKDSEAEAKGVRNPRFMCFFVMAVAKIDG